MNEQRWQQLDSLLDKVLDLPMPRRKEFIARACGGDEELRRDLESLVEAAEKAEDFIETPAVSAGMAMLNAPLGDHLVGARIGVYRLTKMLGCGGMGAVYLATRTDDYRKEVAVKLTSPVFKNETNAAVFKRERQILARLEHPNIAHLLDGGTTDDGVPFLVMEYIDGLPLTTYAERNKLNIRQRLKLFLDICSAVAYAHHNLVIHRDLKPNNILVTADGVPKLLDFGIAKLVQPDPEETSDAVTIGAGVLTPDYASPEQIMGGDVTTASDVYSLGVVLYELLTGERPFSLRNRSLPEIMAAVEHGEPHAPSDTATRNGEPKLGRLLAGDLDAIVLTALGKHPEDRYRTVEELSADIGRFLADAPVEARRPTVSYRAWKFFRRYKFQLAAASVFLFLLVGWAVTAMFQAGAARDIARANRRTAYAAEMVLAAKAWEDANLIRLRELVEKQVPKPGEEDLRGFEWYLLKRLSQPESQMKSLRHEDVVWSVAFSPDGATVATGCNDGVVRLWDVKSGIKLVETTPVGSAWSIRFYPDGSKFAVVGSTRADTAVRIFNRGNGKEVLTLAGHGGRVRGLDISPDGKLVATGSRDGTARVWDALTGAELQQLPFQNGEVQFVAFSPDGKWLASGGSQLLVIYEVGTWQPVAVSKPRTDFESYGDLWCGGFSPDSRRLFCGGFDGSVMVFDALSGLLKRKFPTHKGTIKSICVTADGKQVVTGSWDQTIKFTEIETGHVKHELHGHSSQIHGMALSPDQSTLATASADFTASLWRMSDIIGQTPFNDVPSTACDISPDGGKMLTVSLSDDKGVYSLFNLADGTTAFRPVQEESAAAIRLSPDGTRFATSHTSGKLLIFRTDTGTVERRIQAFEGTSYDLAFSPDGKTIAILGPDGLAKTFDVATGRELAVLKGHKKLLKKVVYSPDGRFIATAGLDSAIKIWDSATGQARFTLLDHVKPIEALAFSRDGQFLASGGGDDVIRIWNVADGRLLSEFTGSSGSVSALVFSPDGKRLASASEVNVIHLWDTATGQQVIAYTAHEKLIRGLFFSQDGTTLFSYGGENRIKVWRAAPR